MMAPPFHGFPSTRHLTWLGGEEVRAEKVMSAAEATAFLSGRVRVEEKVDGANIGLSTDEDGGLWVQNRGAWITPPGAAQFSALWPWLEPRTPRLVDALWPDLILFGEWCHACHAIAYDALPDWFLGFDVFDRSVGRFWSAARRDALLGDLGLAAVPLVGEGEWTVAAVVGSIGRSRLTDGLMEGVYLRRESEDWLVERAKVVRAGFIQPGAEHWSRQAPRRNRVVWGNGPARTGEG